jgi:5-methylcytosine-specific restriction endonuclease McrBC regulatory subunit McrC
MASEVKATKRIKLQEYGSPVVHPSRDINLRGLDDANKRWARILGLSSDPIQMEEIGNGLVQLRAEAVTGVVRIGDTDIEIAPKFLNAFEANWQTVLWRILMVVEGGQVDDSLTTAQRQESLSMPDLLAELFLASYAKGAARGLPRSYLSEHVIGNTLRGSLDVSRVGVWLARPWEIPFVADFLNDNTPLARLLRWSAECLAATVKSSGRARALREIAAGLAHVGKQPPHLLDSQKISLGIQHQALETARVVGLLLLEGAGVYHYSGKYSISGFLWNSDLIYENYVFWLCRRAASSGGVRVVKSTIRFGEVIAGAGTRLETTPDVVFRDHLGIPIAITDSKYKRLGSRPKAPDTYQVLTASHVLGCQRVSLTYPVAVNREPTVWRIPSALGGSDIELTALPLNLMALAKPDGQKALVQSIKTWLFGDLFINQNCT